MKQSNPSPLFNPYLMLSANTKPWNQPTYLHLPHRTPLPHGILPRRAQKQVQILLIDHSDHITIIPQLDLQRRPEPIFLADFPLKFTILNGRLDNDVPCIFRGMGFDAKFANFRSARTASSRVSQRRTCISLHSRDAYHFKLGVVEWISLVVGTAVFFFLVDELFSFSYWGPAYAIGHRSETVVIAIPFFWGHVFDHRRRRRVTQPPSVTAKSSM